ncbi:winged helix-turn-helix transcriptional regulator [Virgibacillus sp. LDC-1]|uniref:helix-turn-helix transcriptional regulator n=1 Tax=Virgibacillus sp. LDC-1 TaxID=3039856 RepID=UPI0024DE3068|nr:winged helix-turn-helix transcriptional regulator [Virgibacillus sp. LDC-1]
MLNKHVSTKERILLTLKKCNEMTIDEITAFFPISDIAVRKHVRELEKQGLVKKNTIKQKIGRPYHTYSLSKLGHDTFPNQYEQLPVELLQDLEEMQGKDAVLALLNKRAAREKTDLQAELTADNIQDKATEMAKLQEKKGYMIEVEQIEDGLVEIRNYHCPIANIASSYQQVCNNEKKMYEEIFADSEVIAHTCITDGEPLCKWTIKKKEKDD